MTRRHHAHRRRGRHIVSQAGWLVYALAATTNPEEVLVGGHTRIKVSADGTTVVDVRTGDFGSNHERTSRCIALVVQAVSGAISHSAVRA